MGVTYIPSHELEPWELKQQQKNWQAVSKSVVLLSTKQYFLVWERRIRS